VSLLPVHSIIDGDVMSDAPLTPQEVSASILNVVGIITAYHQQIDPVGLVSEATVREVTAMLGAACGLLYEAYIAHAHNYGGQVEEILQAVSAAGIKLGGQL
jgi:hypothetical protein